MKSLLRQRISITHISLEITADKFGSNCSLHFMELWLLISSLVKEFIVKKILNSWHTFLTKVPAIKEFIVKKKLNSYHTRVTKFPATKPN